MILEAVIVALRAARANKLRTLLTALGNIIAVMALVLVVAFVQGLNHEITRAILARGADTFFVERYGPIHSEEEWDKVKDRPPIEPEDADAVRRDGTLVAHVLSQWDFNVQARGRRETLSRVRIESRSSEYVYFLEQPLAEGRHFTPTEDRRGVPVAVIGSDIAEALFPTEQPLGRSIRLGQRKFDVIGVMAPRGAILGQSQDTYVIVPLGAAAAAWGKPDDIEIAVKPHRPELMDPAADEVRAILRARRGLRPGEQDPFEILAAATYLKLYQESTRAVYAALVGLVALALLVGGVVIANVMLMVVTQRTREIGIRKAVGARRSHIVTQFLVESSTLSLVGGLIGFAIGAAITAALDAATPLTFAIEGWSVGLGLALVLVVGVVAGLYPAVRAARMDPIVALRHER